MSKPNEPVPELLIERLALADLDPESTADIRVRLAATDGLERLSELEESNRQILAVHPPAPVYAEVLRRLRRPAARSRRVRSLWPPIAVGAAAALAMVFAISRPGPKSLGEGTPSVGSEAAETIRLKGLRPHLVIYKKTPSGPARLGDRSLVRPGDTIQVAYIAAGRRFGVVASQDARGNVTLLLPTGGVGAATLAERGETATSNAFELDDSPGFERFVFVTSNEPFPTSLVLDALRSQHKAKLPPGASITEVVLSKEVQ